MPKVTVFTDNDGNEFKCSPGKDGRIFFDVGVPYSDDTAGIGNGCMSLDRDDVRELIEALSEMIGGGDPLDAGYIAED